MKAINCLNFKHIASIFILLLLSMFLLSFFYKNNVIGDGLQSFNADSLKRYIKILSSDEYEGRKPFTRAETKTINYLHVAGWVSASAQGALLTYGLVKPPQIQLLDIFSSVVGSIGLAAGKVVFGWINSH